MAHADCRAKACEAGYELAQWRSMFGAQRARQAGHRAGAANRIDKVAMRVISPVSSPRFRKIVAAHQRAQRAQALRVECRVAVADTDCRPKAYEVGG